MNEFNIQTAINTPTKIEKQETDIKATDIITNSDDSSFVNEENSLLDHIMQLKNIVLTSLVVWLFFTVISWFFLDKLQAIIFAPAISLGLTLNFISPIEGLMFTFKLAALSGFVVSIPFITLFIWRYVHTALKIEEKKAIISFSIASSLLTVVAIAYSWFALVPSSLKFLIDFTPKGTQIWLTVSEYFSFIFSLTIALVLIFQIPTLVYILIKTKIVSVQQVTSKRREIYLGIIILTALFGSPDFFSWFLTTIPAILLFEVAVLLARISTRKAK